MEASAGDYSVDEDNQLQPEDTLIDRGVDATYSTRDIRRPRNHTEVPPSTRDPKA